jgi:hypothetical protein
VNGKTGDVTIGIGDISGLQTSIDDAKFDGDLTGNLTIGSTQSSYQLRLNGGLVECAPTGINNVPNMKITANSLRVEGMLVSGENQALWGFDDVVGLVNLLRISHSDVKDLIYLGFHDFLLQLYHAEWTGVSDKNITVMKSYISNGSRTEVKELLAYVSDLNSITGNLAVTGRTTTQALTVGVEAIISGSMVVGSGPTTMLQVNGAFMAINDASIGGNLTANGNISGKN